MKCNKIHNKLIFFLEGNLSKEETEQIQLHLNRCNHCQAFATEMKKTLGIIELEKTPKINPFFYTRLKAKLENIHQEEKVRTWQPALVKIIQPVVFSILLLTGIYSGYKIGQPLKTESELLTTSELFPFMNEMNSEPIETFLIEE